MQRACILREIARDTDTFREVMNFGPLEGVPSSHIPSPLLNLPAIPDIQPQLIEAGLSQQLAQSLYLSYCDKASRHRLRTLRQMDRLTDLLGPPNDSVVKTLSTNFSKQLEKWRDQAINCAYTKHSPTQLACKRTRRSFDSKSTPLLKSYFRRNAYPSASEKHTIAMWTGMSPRQIEVWFQNNRNRCRRDQLLIRSSEPPPLEDLLESLAPCPTPKHAKAALNPPSQSPTIRACLPIRSPTTTQSNPLNPPAPLHAFPMPFPPHCNYEPFPKEPRQYRLLPWPRTPYTRRRNHQASLDKNFLEELSDNFSLRLSLRKGNRKRSYDAVDSAEPESFRCPFYTYLPQSRHLAFVANDSRRTPLYPSPDTTCHSNQPPRPAKRLRSSATHAQRTRSTSASSTSSCPSPSTPPTPVESPVQVHRDFDHRACPDFREFDTNPAFPPPRSHLPAFKPFAGPPIRFGLLL